MKNILFIIALLLSVAGGAHTYYISPTGSDAAAGTFAAPRFTISSAWGLMSTSDTLICRGGTYNYTTTQRAQNKSGTVTNRIAILAYQNERPVFDFYGCRSTGLVQAFATGGNNYIHIRGLRFTNLPQLEGGTAEVLFLLATNTNYALIENCEFDHCGGYGLTISGSCDNNVILNCDSHHNEDPYTSPAYDGANGFGMTNNTTSDNNVFRGCRAWMNSDDGFDFFGSNTYVELDNNWSMANGYNSSFTHTGNGVGFKLGPNTDGVRTDYKRKITNCLAVDNYYIGFDKNFNLNGLNNFPSILYNNSAYRNGSIGFSFGNFQNKHRIKNNLAYLNDPDYDLNDSASIVTNSWQVATVTVGDFMSLDTAQLYGARQADGSLPVVTFLKPVAGSDMINAGTDVGLNFVSPLPDIGCFEFTPAAESKKLLKKSGKLIFTTKPIKH